LIVIEGENCHFVALGLLARDGIFTDRTAAVLLFCCSDERKNE
jgi:hypothetical protein